MRFLPLCLFLASSTVFAAEGLIPLPADAVAVQPTPPGIRLPGVAPGADYSSQLPASLDGASEAQYKEFFNNLILNKKKSVLATKARSILPLFNSQVRCLEHEQAFGFSANNEMDYTFNCIAGVGRRPSHMVTYRLVLEAAPNGCASAAGVNSFFANAANRNRRAAGTFYNNWLACANSMAAYSSPASPNAVQSTAPLTQAYINQLLRDRDQLDIFVNGRRANAPARVPVADQETPSTSRPSRRPAREDDEEVPRTVIPCAPGSVLCNSGSAN